MECVDTYRHKSMHMWLCMTSPLRPAFLAKGTRPPKLMRQASVCTTLVHKQTHAPHVQPLIMQHHLVSTQNMEEVQMPVQTEPIKWKPRRGMLAEDPALWNGDFIFEESDWIAINTSTCMNVLRSRVSSSFHIAKRTRLHCSYKHVLIVLNKKPGLIQIALRRGNRLPSVMKSLSRNGFHGKSYQVVVCSQDTILLGLINIYVQS